jgi:predicted enzyme related to lactoylglutathione lyase
MTKVESYPQGTPCWADLTTTDIEGAKSFYSSLFGWNYDAMPMSPDMTYYMATVNGDTVAGLAQQPPEMAGMPPVWGTYIAVDSADTTATKVVEAGGSLLFPPDDVPGAGRMLIAKDNRGTVIGFWEAKGHIGSRVVGDPGAIIWNELQVDDVAAALPFYKTVVGLESETAPFGDMGDYTQFMLNGKSVAGAWKKTMPEEPNNWAVYFSVTDTDATVTKTQKLGGKVIAPAFNIPEVGRMAVLSDPQGAVFCILTSTMSAG